MQQNNGVGEEQQTTEESLLHPRKATPTVQTAFRMRDVVATQVRKGRLQRIAIFLLSPLR